MPRRLPGGSATRKIVATPPGECKAAILKAAILKHSHGIHTDHASRAERAARPAITRTTIGRTSASAAAGVSEIPVESQCAILQTSNTSASRRESFGVSTNMGLAGLRRSHITSFVQGWIQP
jgi:hypothetical protein